MNYLSFFRSFALFAAVATTAHADGTDLGPAAHAHLETVACATGKAIPAPGRAEALVSYALLHAGSGLATFGFPFSKTPEGAAPDPTGPSLWQAGPADAVASPPGATAASCCGRGAETAGGGVCAGRIAGPGEGVDVVEMLENVAARDATVSILRTFDGDTLRLETPQGPRLFAIPALYVTGGILRHRDGVSDTELGRIMAIAR